MFISEHGGAQFSVDMVGRMTEAAVQSAEMVRTASASGNRPERTFRRLDRASRQGDHLVGPLGRQRNAGMMWRANSSSWRWLSSQLMNPWSKNQPNHSSSPLPPILCSASMSRLT